jgi:hypothetical protein
MSFASGLDIAEINGDLLLEKKVLTESDLTTLVDVGVDPSKIKLRGQFRNIVVLNKRSGGPIIVTDFSKSENANVLVKHIRVFTSKAVLSMLVQEHWAITIKTRKKCVFTITEQVIAVALGNAVSNAVVDKINKAFSDEGFVYKEKVEVSKSMSACVYGIKKSPQVIGSVVYSILLIVGLRDESTLSVMVN